MISRTEFAKLVAEELARARSTIPPLNSFHEGYGVIFEELCEFFDEVRKKRRDRDPAKLLAELVQVAAACQRTAEDRGLMGDGRAIPGEDAKVDEVDEVDGQHGQPSPIPPPGGFAATPPKGEGREVIVGSFRDSEGWAHVTDDGRLRDKVDAHFDEQYELRNCLAFNTDSDTYPHEMAVHREDSNFNIGNCCIHCRADVLTYITPRRETVLFDIGTKTIHRCQEDQSNSR